MAIQCNSIQSRKQNEPHLYNLLWNNLQEKLSFKKKNSKVPSDVHKYIHVCVKEVCVCVYIHLDVPGLFLDLTVLTSGVGKWEAGVQGERNTCFLL